MSLLFDTWYEYQTDTGEVSTRARIMRKRATFAVHRGSTLTFPLILPTVVFLQHFYTGDNMGEARAATCQARACAIAQAFPGTGCFVWGRR